MTQQTDWRTAYRESDQYEIDRSKAIEMGHTPQAFGVCVARSRSQEEWNTRLERFQQPHARSRQPQSEWKQEICSSEQFRDLKETAVANGWSQLALARTLSTSYSAEEWQQKAEKFFQQPDSN